MPITLNQIVEATRELPNDTVAELIDRSLVARRGGVNLTVASAWKSATDRRIAEIESDKVKGMMPAENAAHIQRILQHV